MGKYRRTKSIKFTIKAPFTKTPRFLCNFNFHCFAYNISYCTVQGKTASEEKQILEEKVKERTAEIEAQKEEITSSIEYASRIQMAMLPEE